MNYNDLKDLEDNNKTPILSMFSGVLSTIKNTSASKLTSIIKDIPTICKLHYTSYEYSLLKKNNYGKYLMKTYKKNKKEGK